MKSNFLNRLKQGLFLLIAVLGTLISYSQPTQTTTIGGSKTPGMVSFFDVGGKKDPEPVLFTNQSASIQFDKVPIFEIGGRSLHPVFFSIVHENGGKSKPEPILINIENHFDKSQEKFLTKSIVKDYIIGMVLLDYPESQGVKTSLVV